MTSDAMVEFAERLGRIAASGGGPTALASHLADAARLSVLVEDAEWKPIATAGSGTIPASARGLNGLVLTLPLLAGSAQLGWLSLFPASEEQRSAVVPLARLTAASIGVELARDAGSLRTKRRAFWERLLTGVYHDAAAAREDASARGIALAPSYLCIAFETDEVEHLGEVRAMAAEALRIDGETSMLERGSTLVIFVPAEREVDVANARTASALLPKSAIKRNVQLRLTGGIAPVAPALELGESLERAQAAVAIARRLYGGGKVVTYEELGAYPLLYSGAGSAELRAFATAAIAPLRAYDAQHQTELERTLRLYFSSGENVKTTAAELNVHRHTVFYRLRQIAEISGRSLESGHDQLTLRLAIAIDALNT